jgi:hypothetical protein
MTNCLNLYFVEIHFNIILLFMNRSPKWYILFKMLYQYFVCIYFRMRATCPVYVMALI